MPITLLMEVEKSFVKTNGIKLITAFNSRGIKAFTKAYDFEGNLTEEIRFRQLIFGNKKSNGKQIGDILCKHNYKYESGRKTEEIKSFQNRIPIEIDDFGYFIYKRKYKYDLEGKLIETVWYEEENLPKGRCNFQYEKNNSLVDIEATSNGYLLYNIIFSYPRGNIIKSELVTPYNPKFKNQILAYKNFKLDDDGNLIELEIFDKYGKNGKTYPTNISHENLCSLIDFNLKLKVTFEYF